MNDSGRLQAAIAGLECALALTLMDEANPPLEDVDHLEIEIVLMQTGAVQAIRAGTFLDPDDVRPVAPVGRVSKPRDPDIP